MTLPQAGTTGFANGFFYATSNGGAGVVTITPTAPSTINGNTTLVLNEGDACRIGPNSTGASYAADCAPPQLIAGTGITLTPGVHSLTIASTASATPSFSAISSGTNTTAAMIVGTGASLTVSGSGTINSTTLNGATFAAPGAIGGTTPGAGTFTTLIGKTSVTAGVVGTTAGLLNLSGSTSGTATFTAPAVAGTAGNPVVSSNAISLPDGTAGSPGLAFTANPTEGIYGNAGGMVFNTISGKSFVFQTGGSTIYQMSATSIFSNSDGAVALGAPGNHWSSLFLANCSAAGSAASPSIVACGASVTGAFSCATNASGATCQVNTTAVTTNSVIEITQTASAGTRLGVTCNATADTPTGPRIASISNGASFTINLGTVSVNPSCYFFTITN